MGRYLYYQISQIIMKCDLSRYAVLYFYGGIYHDLDYICYQPFDSLIANRDILLCREPVETTEVMIVPGTGSCGELHSGISGATSLLGILVG